MTAFIKGVDFEQLARWYTFGAQGKYRTLRDYSIETEFRPDEVLSGKFGQVLLAPRGLLAISSGHVWDGASGPTWDSASTMRASLVHDALYQLMREQNLDANADRAQADRLLWRIMWNDLSPRWARWRVLRWVHRRRVNAWLWGVRHFAAGAARGTV